MSLPFGSQGPHGVLFFFFFLAIVGLGLLPESLNTDFVKLPVLKSGLNIHLN